MQEFEEKSKLHAAAVEKNDTVEQQNIQVNTIFG
jgi:hypothetical protein